MSRIRAGVGSAVLVTYMVSLATLFPISILRTARAHQLTNATIVFENAYHQWDSNDHERRFDRFNIRRLATRIATLPVSGPADLAGKKVRIHSASRGDDTGTDGPEDETFFLGTDGELLVSHMFIEDIRAVVTEESRRKAFIDALEKKRG